MTLIFFIIFAIAIFGVMLVLTLLKGIASLLFGRSNTSSNNKNNRYSQKNNYYSQNSHSGDDNQKVFSKDEGEYVKFEEIKD